MGFNIMAFVEYINKEKKLNIDASYYSHVEEWRHWWEGYLPKVHDIVEYDEETSTKRRMASLRMPKHVCEDWANLLLNDKTTFQIGDAKTAAYLLGSDEQQTGGLLRQLHFWENANKLVEKAFWSGTGAFVLSLENFTVNAAGDIRPADNTDTRLVLDYEPASGILPIRVEHGIVKDAAFVSEIKLDGQSYIHLQTQMEQENGIHITNEWFQVTDGASESPTFTPNTPENAPTGLVRELTIRKDSPRWFALFSPAAEKNIDGGLGLGMAVFAEALDAAQGADLAFDNYRQDLVLGGKKIFYDRDLCQRYIGKDGKEHIVTPDMTRRQQFYSLPKKEGALDAASEWHEYNPDLRTEDNHRAVQDMLDLFSFKCGLGGHRYKFEYGRVTTATEYTGSNQVLVQSANKNQIPIETALIGILRAILWAAKNLLGEDVDPDTSISVNWDDSYIVSEQERISQLREDALAGLVPRCRYLSARYGLSEKEAHAWAEEAKADSHTDEALSFGGA